MAGREGGWGGGWRRRAPAGWGTRGGGLPRACPEWGTPEATRGTRAESFPAAERGDVWFPGAASPGTATGVGVLPRRVAEALGRVPPRTRPCTSAWLFKLLTKRRREASSPPRA